MNLPGILRAAGRLPLSGKIGLALVLFWIAVAAIGPFIAPYPPGLFANEEVFAGASRQFWLGSDFLGRDVLSRLLVGARFTVGLSAVAVTIAASIGTGLALAAAVGPR
ncbi:MAG: ABC transporter permease, partial [Novosphingobium sp.]|nr:ABC transporter permease [Novosphingobium sp.]